MPIFILPSILINNVRQVASVSWVKSQDNTQTNQNKAFLLSVPHSYEIVKCNNQNVSLQNNSLFDCINLCSNITGSFLTLLYCDLCICYVTFDRLRKRRKRRSFSLKESNVTLVDQKTLIQKRIRYIFSFSDLHIHRFDRTSSQTDR